MSMSRILFPWKQNDRIAVLGIKVCTENTLKGIFKMEMAEKKTINLYGSKQNEIDQWMSCISPVAKEAEPCEY